jgi:ATP-dependent RNA helicase DeaD
MFSATIPPEVERLHQRYLRDPERLSLSSDTLIVREVDHSYVEVPTMEKEEALYKLLVSELPESCIVFCNTRGEARVVTGYLQQRGLPVELLSGELSQSQREKVMHAIKAHRLRYMVATDVAARGIDIADLSHVFQFSPPEDPAMYVHRAGRTGRMGKGGTAITLVGFRELIRFTAIEKLPGLKIHKREPPGDEEVLEARVEAVMERLRQAELGADAIDPQARGPYQAAAEYWLAHGLTVEELTAMLKALDGKSVEAPEPAAVPSQASAGPDHRPGQRRRRRRSHRAAGRRP